MPDYNHRVVTEINGKLEQVVDEFYRLGLGREVIIALASTLQSAPTNYEHKSSIPECGAIDCIMRSVLAILRGEFISNKDGYIFEKLRIGVSELNYKLVRQER